MRRYKAPHKKTAKTAKVVARCLRIDSLGKPHDIALCGEAVLASFQGLQCKADMRSAPHKHINGVLPRVTYLQVYNAVVVLELMTRNYRGRLL